MESFLAFLQEDLSDLLFVDVLLELLHMLVAGILDGRQECTRTFGRDDVFSQMVLRFNDPV